MPCCHLDRQPHFPDTVHVHLALTRHLLAPVARHHISRLFKTTNRLSCWVGSVVAANKTLQGLNGIPLFQMISAKLFCSPSQCDYRVHIRPNELSHRGTPPCFGTSPSDPGVKLPLTECSFPALFLKIFKYNLCFLKLCLYFMSVCCSLDTLLCCL